MIEFAALSAVKRERPDLMSYPLRLLTHSACVAALSSALVTMPAAAADARYPATPKRPVTDTYHGVTVVDDYRWLEDDANAEAQRPAGRRRPRPPRPRVGPRGKPPRPAAISTASRNVPRSLPASASSFDR